MLACAACGRAYKARALTPWSLSTATCPSCGGDLSVVAVKRPIDGQPPPRGRFVPHTVARDQLAQRLNGLGA
jgi:uncharacterized protein YbaR (Trm112 family)